MARLESKASVTALLSKRLDFFSKMEKKLNTTMKDMGFERFVKSGQYLELFQFEVEERLTRDLYGQVSASDDDEKLIQALSSAMGNVHGFAFGHIEMHPAWPQERQAWMDFKDTVYQCLQLVKP